MISPAYLMSPNGAYALYLSAAGDLSLHAIGSNGALEAEPYWSQGGTDTLSFIKTQTDPFSDKM